ncbi:MAG: hypothetical protein KAG53_05825 [Endozoicomonadaceae bacterium]|nr:hypothetical protein [Endozoicomonadaceae bacterium]
MSMNLDINSGLTGISHQTNNVELPDLGTSRKTNVSTTNSFSVVDNVGNALGYDNQDKKLEDFARNNVRHQYSTSEHKNILSSSKELIKAEVKSDRPENEQQLLQDMLAVIEKDEMLFNDAQMARRVLIAV